MKLQDSARLVRAKCTELEGLPCRHPTCAYKSSLAPANSMASTKLNGLSCSPLKCATRRTLSQKKVACNERRSVCFGIFKSSAHVQLGRPPGPAAEQSTCTRITEAISTLLEGFSLACHTKLGSPVLHRPGLRNSKAQSKSCYSF